MAWIRTIERKGGKRSYRVCYRDPQGRTRSKTFRRKEDATRFAHQIEADKSRGEYRDPKAGKQTFGEYVDKVLPLLSHLRDSTRALYEGQARRYLLPAFGRIPLREITPASVRNFLASLSETKGPSTVRSCQRLLSRILEEAVADGLIASNPARRPKLERERPREPRFLEPDELARLAEEVPDRYKALIYLLGYGGLRIGEAAALRRDDIDTKARRVHVRRTIAEVAGRLVESLPKSGKPRVVVIPDFLAKMLAEHMLAYPGERVFTTEQGGVLRVGNFRKRIFYPAARRAGLAGLKIHDLRHTAASLAIRAGGHPKAVSEMLGHANISITMDRYGHLFPSQLEQLADAMGELKPQGEVIRLKRGARARRPEAE
jgi:integrase